MADIRWFCKAVSAGPKVPYFQTKTGGLPSISIQILCFNGVFLIYTAILSIPIKISAKLSIPIKLGLLAYLPYYVVINDHRLYFRLMVLYTTHEKEEKLTLLKRTNLIMKWKKTYNRLFCLKSNLFHFGLPRVTIVLVSA